MQCDRGFDYRGQYINKQMHLLKYNNTQFMTNMKHLQVSTPGCHPQEVLQYKGTQAQHANLDTDHTHYNY